MGQSSANLLAVDKAVNYILGQPDGKLVEQLQLLVQLLIHLFSSLKPVSSQGYVRWRGRLRILSMPQWLCPWGAFL